MKTICILNNKGGVGKTTSVLNIGGGLARRGYKVLMVDLDPQMNLTQSTGAEDISRDIYKTLTGRSKLSPVEVADNLYLVPSSRDLKYIESEFSSKIGGQVRLRKVLSDVDDYDFCLIDCPPSLGLLSINAMTASQEMIVPLTPEYYSVQGVLSLTETIEEVKDSLNAELKLSGIIITLYNKQKIVHRDFAEAIQRNFGDIVFSTRVRSSVAIEESPTQGQDVFRYSPHSNGAKDYSAIVDEFLDRQNCNNVIM